MNSISEELDGTTRSQTSMGNRSSPNRSSLGRSSPGMGTSPQRKARYRNQNHVVTCSITIRKDGTRTTNGFICSSINLASLSNTSQSGRVTSP